MAHLGDPLRRLQEQLQRNVQAIAHNLHNATAEAAQAVQQALMPRGGVVPLFAVSPFAAMAPLHAGLARRNGLRPPPPRPLQSVSAALGRPAAAAAATVRSGAQPLFDLALANPEEIKARLNAVPVYVVVNNKNEFVLVAGDVSWAKAGPGWRHRREMHLRPCSACDSQLKLGPPCRTTCTLHHVQNDDSKQLSLFFFSEAEAEALLKTVRRAVGRGAAVAAVWQAGRPGAAAPARPVAGYSSR